MKHNYVIILLIISVLIGFSACEKEPFDENPPVTNNPNDTTNVNLPLKFCNGYTSLCEKGYDEVLYPTTHNSYNYANGPVNFQLPNQQWPVSKQLDDGIRGLVLDVYPYAGSKPELQGQPMVFNDINILGQEPFVDVLKEVKTFLDNHPNEVITLLLDCHVNSGIMLLAFTEADLLDYAHEQAIGEPWPTLREMINADKRLVIFSDCDAVSSLPWYHHVWDYAVETNDFNTQLSDFNCQLTKGDPSNDLFILNHYVSDQSLGTGNSDLALQANSNPFMVNRMLQCIDETGKIPNFMVVDFYASGDVMKTAAIINEVD